MEGFVIDSKTKSLVVVLDAIKTTNDMEISCSYIDTIIPQQRTTKTNGITPVTIVSGTPINQAPPVNTNKRIIELTICNKDTAQKKVSVYILDGATQISKMVVDLDVNFTLHFDSNGWYVTDQTGAFYIVTISLTGLQIGETVIDGVVNEYLYVDGAGTLQQGWLYQDANALLIKDGKNISSTTDDLLQMQIQGGGIFNVYSDGDAHAETYLQFNPYVFSAGHLVYGTYIATGAGGAELGSNDGYFNTGGTLSAGTNQMSIFSSQAYIEHNTKISLNSPTIQLSVDGDTLNDSNLQLQSNFAQLFGGTDSYLQLQTGMISTLAALSSTGNISVAAGGDAVMSGSSGVIQITSSLISIPPQNQITLTSSEIYFRHITQLTFVAPAYNFANATASTVPYIDASKNLISSIVTPTELGYLSGASSNIQNQINNINAGLSWKVAVRAATTANIVLLGAQTIDGVAIIAGDRVLVKNQTTGADNGIYVCAVGAWARASDATTGGSGSTGILQATMSIEEGGTYADQIWTCTTNAPIVIGVTSLVFAKTSATTYTGSDGITLTGNNFTLDNSYFSGDATVAAGVISIGANKILDSMINSVAWSKITSTPTTLAGYGITNAVVANTAIATATKTKITYDTKGLVTAGADATTSDIAEGSNLYFTTARVDTQVATYTGDVTLSGTSLIIGSGKVTNTMLAGSITYAKLSISNSVLYSDLASMTSANLLTKISDATGTGFNVFATAPNLLLPKISDSTDSTKSIAFTLSGATTGKTLTLISSHSNDISITFPNASDTLVGKATTDVLTNKTLTSPLISNNVGSIAGSLEYDGLCFYTTPLTGARGVSPSVMYSVVDAGGFALQTTSGSGQACFPTTGDVWTLSDNTSYRFRGRYYITKSGTTTQIGLLFALGGGASVTSITYSGTAGSLVVAPLHFWTNFVNNNYVSATSTVATLIIFEGIIRMNAGGTVTPQIQFSSSPTSPVMTANSFIEFIPIGTNTNNVMGNVG